MSTLSIDYKAFIHCIHILQENHKEKYSKHNNSALDMKSKSESLKIFYLEGKMDKMEVQRESQAHIQFGRI